MKLIDTHSHIYSEAFDEDIAEAIQRAKDANVGQIFLPNIDSESIEPMFKLVKNYPDYCLPMMGLHPTSVKENYEEELAICEKWLKKESFIAIGEIGIDLYWDKTFLKEQQLVFEKQLNWAVERELPVVIHARESFSEIFEVLEPFKSKNLTGVFHSFTGNLEQANKAISMGFLLGLNGILTFKNSGLDRVVKEIDTKYLILETDSPYLAPTPKRGKRNESAYVAFIAEKLAEIHNLSLDEVTKITSRNAQNLFKI
ncbi:TatD family deoxyribonuclease [Ancylomarina euxinus]|uniref:TatD family deoxyribonuclease n=1 Tax=Ancylomarina euxinus TaxID=2283627 RepID=A0A425Y111_9BACT|nr:TatD family hydrolase [Ancylomarina euxinus]MCZ4693762.1 TatD family hydrolase [Ancylomarina euxinus]MUP15158.1 YchF/TatD family DNA exonuclease [Ancylomarina euxinus]RRG21581.1 TatD family deoxyribonuclease [Ancylomarina euxinus]